MDLYNILAIFIAIISITFSIYQHIQNKPKLKVQMSYGMAANNNGEGVYLAAKLFISNIGGGPAIFNGLEAKDTKGEIFYPSYDGQIGTKIEPNESLILNTPNGHLLTHGTSQLSIVDGVFKKHRISNRVLKKLLTELSSERDRLENIGCNVHPPSLFERHNK